MENSDSPRSGSKRKREHKSNRSHAEQRDTGMHQPASSDKPFLSSEDDPGSSLLQESGTGKGSESRSTKRRRLSITVSTRKPDAQGVSEAANQSSSRDPGSNPAHATNKAVVSTRGTGPHSSSRPHITAKEHEQLRETIITNFSTRILYKHNELRLIDQEIAKCQIALEQLRRCSVIPYPSMSGAVKDMINVSTGSGPALASPQSGNPPALPSPWGVEDGPYSRHYSRWLLPDPLFDGGPRQPSLSTAQSNPDMAQGRASQAGTDSAVTSSRSRGQRGSTQAVLQSLPSGYAQPKPERAAQIIKRQADGMYVKLVCPGCNEEKFNSVQGFINHCRIKHQVHFATHEDAAKRAGTTDGVNQSISPSAEGKLKPSAGVARATTWQPAAGNAPESPERLLISNPMNDHSDQPIIRRSSVALSKPQSPSLGRTGTAPSRTVHSTDARYSSGTLTHPYNKLDLDTLREWPEQRQLLVSGNTPSPTPRERKRRQSNMGPPISPGFTPSEQLPFLSELFVNAGKAGNLHAMVQEAQDRFNMDDVAVPEFAMEAEATDYPQSATPAHARIPREHETTGGLGAPLMDRRPDSLKGARFGPPFRTATVNEELNSEDGSFLAKTRSNGRRGKSEKLEASALATSLHQGISATSDDPATSIVNDSAGAKLSKFSGHSHHLTIAPDADLSPTTHHATDTNQAPSLVSDDGQSGSESEYDGDEEHVEGDRTPKPPEEAARISFDGMDEMMSDTAAPSTLPVDEKVGQWHGNTGRSGGRRTA